MTDPYFQAPVAALGKVQVDIVRLEVQYDYVTKQLEALKQSNEALSVQLDAINKLLNEASGGWRMLMLVGGASAAFGGLISWALNYVRLG